MKNEVQTGKKIASNVTCKESQTSGRTNYFFLVHPSMWENQSSVGRHLAWLMQFALPSIRSSALAAWVWRKGVREVIVQGGIWVCIEIAVEKLDPAMPIHKSFLSSFQDLTHENIWPKDKGSEYFPWLSGENKNTLVIAFADFHGEHCFYHGQCPDANGLSTSSQNPLVFVSWISELVSVNSGAPGGLFVT